MRPGGELSARPQHTAMRGPAAETQDLPAAVDRDAQAAPLRELATDQDHAPAAEAEPRRGARLLRADHGLPPGRVRTQALPAAREAPQLPLAIVDRNHDGLALDRGPVGGAIGGGHAELIGVPRLTAEVQPIDGRPIEHPAPFRGGVVRPRPVGHVPHIDGVVRDATPGLVVGLPTGAPASGAPVCPSVTCTCTGRPVWAVAGPVSLSGTSTENGIAAQSTSCPASTRFWHPPLSENAWLIHSDQNWVIGSIRSSPTRSRKKSSMPKFPYGPSIVKPATLAASSRAPVAVGPGPGSAPPFVPSQT